MTNTNNRTTSNSIDEVDFWSTEKLDSIDRVHVGARGDRQLEIFKHHFRWLRENIRIPMNPKWRVLEAGQGRFGFSIFYNQYFKKVYGADLHDMSEFHPGVESITADFCQHIPLEDQSINLIVSHSVLEHVDDVGAALRNFDRILKVGGFMFISISPLYYSAAGAHINEPQKLSDWEHLNPDNMYFDVDYPILEGGIPGTYLNKITFSKFISLIGQMPYSILCNKISIDPRPIPSYVDQIAHSETDLRTKGFFLLIKKEWHNQTC